MHRILTIIVATQRILSIHCQKFEYRNLIGWKEYQPGRSSSKTINTILSILITQPIPLSMKLHLPIKSSELFSNYYHLQCHLNLDQLSYFLKEKHRRGIFLPSLMEQRIYCSRSLSDWLIPLRINTTNSFYNVPLGEKGM